MHCYWSEKKTRQHLPFLRTEGLRCAFTYWDALMEDALLVLENLRSATHLGAICLNYVKAGRILGLQEEEAAGALSLNGISGISGIRKEKEGQEMDKGRKKDPNGGRRRSGSGSASASESGSGIEKGEKDSFREFKLECKDEIQGKTFQLRARHIVSSVGPWTDEIGKTWFPSHWNLQLRLSKGVHLWIPSSKLPLSAALVLNDDTNQRIVFVIPHGPNRILVGTTDTEYKGGMDSNSMDPTTSNPTQNAKPTSPRNPDSDSDPDSDTDPNPADNPADTPADTDNHPVHAQKEDVDYLLSLLKSYFPRIPWSYKDVISSYAGLRPLLKEDSPQGKGLSLGQTSREHRIWRAHPHLTFVAGGKYTTYRKVAQEVIDFCLSSFPLEKRGLFRPFQSKSPLHPQCTLENLQKAKEKLKDWAQKYPQYSPSDLSAFIDRHAMETEELLKRYAPHCQRSLWQVEAYYAMEEGMCLHLKDFYQRYPALLTATHVTHHPLPRQNSSQGSFRTPQASQVSPASSDPLQTPPQVEEIAQCFKEHLHWSEEQKKEEIYFLSQFLKSRASFADL